MDQREVNQQYVDRITELKSVVLDAMLEYCSDKEGIKTDLLLDASVNVVVSLAHATCDFNDEDTRKLIDSICVALQGTQLSEGVTIQ